jgi:hypothetical protein
MIRHGQVFFSLNVRAVKILASPGARAALKPDSGRRRPDSSTPSGRRRHRSRRRPDRAAGDRILIRSALVLARERDARLLAPAWALSRVVAQAQTGNAVRICAQKKHQRRAAATVRGIGRVETRRPRASPICRACCRIRRRWCRIHGRRCRIRSVGAIVLMGCVWAISVDRSSAGHRPNYQEPCDLGRPHRASLPRVYWANPRGPARESARSTEKPERRPFRSAT